MTHTETTQARRKATAGFTLVELMVVIAIIAILASIVGYNVLGAMDDGNVAAAKAQIKKLETAIVGYKIKFKNLPDSLDQLVRPPRGDSLLDAKQIPDDPWGNPYKYTVDGSRFTIVSYGADGSPGGAEYDEDISSDNLQGDD